MANQPTKGIPLGNPLDLTDDQLDQLSTITPADIEKAKAFWRNTAPPEFETLLDAQPLKEDEE